MKKRKRKKNFKQKWIRPNMVLEYLILVLKVRALWWRKRERKKRRRRKKEEEENLGMEFMFGTLVWKFLIHVWNFGLEPICMNLLVRKPPNSFFVYIWVRKTLTLQYMCILVGSSQFSGWFSFGWKISNENG